MTWVMSILILACVFVLCVLSIALPFIGIYLIVRLISGPSSRANKGQQAEEARLIQDIHNGLTRMERRVETLETLLTDREKGRERP